MFVIDDLNETYTFFVPQVCGNVSLVGRASRVSPLTSITSFGEV